MRCCGVIRFLSMARMSYASETIASTCASKACVDIRASTASLHADTERAAARPGHPRACFID